MRRFESDRSYTFHPPKPASGWRPLMFAVNEMWFLRHTFRVTNVVVENIEPLLESLRMGQATLITPNHADHSDPHVLLELDRHHALDLRFMATRELFDVSPIHAWALQRFGAFSVDRDGPDLAAFRTAMDVLVGGTSPLVIFPEGEIYHHHEQLDPLHDGACAMLLRAFAKLPPERDASLVPLALRFLHDARVADSFPERITRLETHLGWKPRPDLDPVVRIHRIGSGALALREVEWTGTASGGELPERLRRFSDTLLADVESRQGRDAKAATAPERYRALRQRLRKRLLDDEQPPTADERKGMLDDLDRLFVAFQAYSYPGEYLRAKPSRHRIAETLMKLEEDLLGEPVYAADRTAVARFGNPISLRVLAATEPELTAKGGAPLLTERLEQQLGQLLASIPDEVPAS
jgi:1-acyl-sn-glycerol-3-phosphate acyltransferase